MKFRLQIEYTNKTGLPIHSDFVVESRNELDSLTLELIDEIYTYADLTKPWSING